MLSAYLAGIVLPACAPNRPRAQNALAHGCSVLACGLGIILSLKGLQGQETFSISLDSNLPFLQFAVRLDTLAAFFMLTISLVGVATSIFSLGYVSKFYGKRSIASVGALYNGFLCAMTLVILADHAFFFLIMWEVMSIVSFCLVVTEYENSQARDAGLFYLVMAHVGTAFIVVAFLVFLPDAGSFTFDAFRKAGPLLPQWLQTVVFLTALVGFGTKAGVVPLHVWLPYAHPAAPSHVSALMSAVMIKTAIYGLIRVYFDFLGAVFPWWWGVVVLVVGASSALLGVMYALMEHDMKRLLAYHSVENVGIILLGVGSGMIFQSFRLGELAALGLMAGLYHTLNHAVFKALLFCGAGSLLYATHTRNMEEYGGLLRRMPWTGLFFLVGAVSISALPPTNGFVSEWLIFQNLFLGFQLPEVLLAILLPVAAAMLALTGALALACFAKAFGIAFLALPRSGHARRAEEVPLPMRVGMGLLAALCLVLGLGPMLVIPLLGRVAATLTGASIGAKVLALDGWALAPISMEFSSMSTPALAIVLVVLSGVGLLLAVVLGGRLRTRYYRTWGCGINLTAKMQYTATAFAQPIKRVFSTIYQPTVKLETEFIQESRYFAKRQRFDFRIKPVFEMYLYEPVVGLFAALSERLRSHTVTNEMNLYLGYVFLALLVVLFVTR